MPGPVRPLQEGRAVFGGFRGAFRHEMQVHCWNPGHSDISVAHPRRDLVLTHTKAEVSELPSSTWLCIWSVRPRGCGGTHGWVGEAEQEDLRARAVRGCVTSAHWPHGSHLMMPTRAWKECSDLAGTSLPLGAPSSPRIRECSRAPPCSDGAEVDGFHVRVWPGAR